MPSHNPSLSEVHDARVLHCITIWIGNYLSQTYFIISNININRAVFLWQILKSISTFFPSLPLYFIVVATIANPAIEKSVR